MSKLLDYIEGKWTGKHVLPDPTFEHIDATLRMEPNPIPYSLLREYVFETKFVIRTQCDKRDFKPMTKNVIEQARQMIYGEFRNRLFELERALYERDIRKMESAIRDLKTLTMGQQQ